MLRAVAKWVVVVGLVGCGTGSAVPLDRQGMDVAIGVVAVVIVGDVARCGAAHHARHRRTAVAVAVEAAVDRGAEPLVGGSVADRLPVRLLR